MHGGGAKRRVVVARAVGFALAASLTASGCGSVVDALTGRDTGPEMAKVVVLVPDSGPHREAGDDVFAAVDAALSDVDAGDWDVAVERVADGTGDAEPLESAGEVAGGVADDRDVIAVIGGLTPDAVRAAQRPLNERKIAFLSPADHDRSNTRGPDPSAPQRPYDSYFRTAVPEGDPLTAAADYAVNGAGAATVVVVHDGRPRKAAEVAKYVTSLDADAALARAADVAETAGEVDAQGGTVAFLLVGDANAAGIAQAAEQAGLAPTVIGGERLAAATPPASEGGSTFVAVVPGNPEAPADAPVPEPDDAGRVVAPAHDAGRVVAQMLERCLPSVRGSARDARHGCLSELDTVSVTGATGNVTFDRYGDRPGTWPVVLIGTASGWAEVTAS